MNLSDAVIPVIICFITLYGVFFKTDVFSAFIKGAKNGLTTIVGIFPSVLAMLTCVNMLRASGAIDAFSALFSPAAKFLGIPVECIPLAFLKPISGGGALAIGADIIKKVGVDSLAGRTAAVMLASADTTFFVISVYFGSLRIKNTRHAVPCALIADFTAFIAAAAAVRLLMH